MTDIQLYDVVILGSGPAGIQAAIHASRKKAKTLMLGRPTNSSLYWAHIENYCCMFQVTGEEILHIGREQAKKSGAEFMDEDVLKVEHNGQWYELLTEGEHLIRTRTLIIATGTTRNKLGIPGEKQLLGKGVSYCVDCDAGFFRNETVVVVGSQSAAAGGSLTLAEYASTVHLVCEKLDVAPSLRARIEAKGIIVHEGRKPTEIRGENAVESITLDNGESIEAAGIFIELGAKGVLELASTLGIQLDENMRYVEVDRKLSTNVAGVYAAGDITGPPLQMAKAVGEGCVAGIEAATYAKKLKND
ncbi:NAD(P)/FAD-dependent oxidoreductase [Salidesulfovibrio onnuriiensis]|uniref:NAD(P)/FAD-dependent oxidoreductase n=1 Tax=Salidesulfovibrio onnuriiensis TaxID=2583823 RepID=UPI0011C930A1|nr:FAD-dependent oxidoreductase [Salidesulfovibrio onnuriiensis]